MSQPNAALLTVNRVTRWDGSQWSALGQEVNDIVFAVAASGSNVYVGGRFSQATQTGGGTVAASMIACWNGASWSALGSGTGLGTSVNAIAVMGSTVYVGGEFRQIGGVAATNLACWDGTAWTAVGGGLQAGAYPTVRALLPAGTDLYVAGSFLSSGTGVALNNLARWRWRQLVSAGHRHLRDDQRRGHESRRPFCHGLLHQHGRFAGTGGGPLGWHGVDRPGQRRHLIGHARRQHARHPGQPRVCRREGGYQAYNFGLWTDPALGPRVSFGAFSNSTLQVTWPAADSDSNLQHATALGSSNTRTTVTNAGTTNGGFRIVTLPATNQSGFFRLLQP